MKKNPTSRREHAGSPEGQAAGLPPATVRYGGPAVLSDPSPPSGPSSTSATSEAGRGGGCRHHYLLPSPSPDRPVLLGVCIKCGDKKEHKAFLKANDFLRGPLRVQDREEVNGYEV